MKRPFDVAARLAALAADPAGSTQFTMRIGTDGDWHFQGSRIPRPALVKLFATALQRAADGSYWLVTPVEAGRVEVDDVPFTIVELVVDDPGPNQVIRLRTNLDEWLPIDAEHPLTMRPPPNRTASKSTASAPYVVVRPAAPGRLALEARLLRPVFYQLVELAELESATGSLEVSSAGRHFSLGRVDPT